MSTIAQLAARLARGETSSAALVEEALARAHDPAGEGARTYTRLYDEAARLQARAADALLAQRIVPSPLAGLPISIKDLFDVAGETTRAGSVVLRDAAKAMRDAPVVARLRAAGAIVVGRTNMTEFAFSGLGINPHYGTPKNPYDRATGRIPGGSSSGAAVSVADGSAVVGIGTDTGGSVRIPAALCGLVGFKPTAERVPRTGVLPLSTTLDSIGPIARSVACCALVDAVMAGDAPAPLPALPVRGLRLGVVRDYFLDDLEPAVAQAFERAVTALSAAGARIVDVAFPGLRELPQYNARGGFSAAEAFAWHRELLSRRASEYDPRVAARIRMGEAMSAADYVDLKAQRARLIAQAEEAFAPHDALIAPTVIRTAPAIAPLERDDALFMQTNRAVLRNALAVNFLDGCALSLPCQRAGDAPVGLMLMGLAHWDRRVLAAGLAVDAVLAGVR